MKRRIKIFISYAREDVELAKELYSRLQQAGYKPWIDINDLLPGIKWEDVINKEIKEADFFIPILSHVSIEKRGKFQAEITEALNISKEKLEDDVFIIPIRIKECRIPDRLKEFQCYALDRRDGWDLLLKTVKHHCIEATNSKKITDSKLISFHLRDRFIRTKELNDKYEKFYIHFTKKYLKLMAKNVKKPEIMKHFQEMDSLIHRLCPLNVFNTLSPMESFLLLLGIYMHDIGIIKCFENPNKFPVEDHHIIGRNYFKDIAAEFDLKKESYAISLLIYSHREVSLSGIDEKYAVEREIVRLRFLCGMLRLVDFLDYRHGNISGTAHNITHIINHAAVSGISIDSKKSEIRLSGISTEPKEALYNFNLWSNLQKILESVRETLNANNLPYSRIDIDNEMVRPLLDQFGRQ